MLSDSVFPSNRVPTVDELVALGREGLEDLLLRVRDQLATERLRRMPDLSKRPPSRREQRLEEDLGLVLDALDKLAGLDVDTP
jgi:hypothetical protein